MNKKENSGYIKTHQVIQKSLLALLEQKDFKKITVNDVCTLAKINRSTFYAHFQDLYAVLETIEQSLESALMNAYAADHTLNDNIMSTDYLVILLEHIKENSIFYQAYLSDTASSMLDKSMEMLQNQIVRPLHQKLNMPERYGTYYFNFFKTGFITVLRQWLADGCPESSEQLAAIIVSCIPDFPPELFIF